MVGRTAFFSCRLDIETKRKLREKAAELGLDMTEFIRIIAEQDIVVLDNNIKRLLNAMKLQVNDNCSADSNTNFK